MALVPYAFLIINSFCILKYRQPGPKHRSATRKGATASTNTHAAPQKGGKERQALEEAPGKTESFFRITSTLPLLKSGESSWNRGAARE